MFIFFVVIAMQCPTCYHVMALCHEDKQILYFKCNHGTRVAAGMKCKYCNVIKLSKKDASKTSNTLQRQVRLKENLFQLLFNCPIYVNVFYYVSI